MNKTMATLAAILSWAVVYGVFYAMVGDEEWGRLGFIIVVTLFAPAVLLSLPFTWELYYTSILWRSDTSNESERTYHRKMRTKLLWLAISAWVLNFVVVTIYMLNH